MRLQDKIKMDGDTVVDITATPEDWEFYSYTPELYAKAEEPTAFLNGEIVEILNKRDLSPADMVDEIHATLESLDGDIGATDTEPMAYAREIVEYVEKVRTGETTADLDLPSEGDQGKGSKGSFNFDTELREMKETLEDLYEEDMVTNTTAAFTFGVQLGSRLSEENIISELSAEGGDYKTLVSALLDGILEGLDEE
jgi:hypothetical protein